MNSWVVSVEDGGWMHCACPGYGVAGRGEVGGLFVLLRYVRIGDAPDASTSPPGTAQNDHAGYVHRVGEFTRGEAMLSLVILLSDHWPRINADRLAWGADNDNWPSPAVSLTRHAWNAKKRLVPWYIGSSRRPRSKTLSRLLAGNELPSPKAARLPLDAAPWNEHLR